MNEHKMRKWLSAYNSIFKEDNDLYHATASKYGLSECAFWILYTIRLSDKFYTQSEICEKLFLPAQTINSALKKLERDGFLELKFANNNRKSKQIHLTETGKELAEISADRLIQSEIKALSALSEDEQKTLLLLYGKFVQLLRAELN